MGNERSLTGHYLSGRMEIPVPTLHRKGKGVLVLKGVKHHNLKNVTATFPIGAVTCVTGLSGSGKSSLVIDALCGVMAKRLRRSGKGAVSFGEITGWEGFDRVIRIDQDPIGRTPRSNPATYTEIFDRVRDLFAQLPEARVRGYKSGRFSFNVKGGRCEACEGDGIIRIKMHFLPDLFVTCGLCRGRRYNRETLDILYKGRSIAGVLDLTVNQAVESLGNIPRIRERLETLRGVGLGYLRLGQAATTLSGGEAQRIKLARELSRRSTGSSLYVLDEPTTGLHFHDIKKLLEVLNRLADSGNTIVIVEHNLDVIKSADYIVDLGPEGGDLGGEIVASGTPEEVSLIGKSYTGQFLRKMLQSKAA